MWAVPGEDQEAFVLAAADAHFHRILPHCDGDMSICGGRGSFMIEGRAGVEAACAAYRPLVRATARR
jgi:hypothetical protein